MIDNLLAIFTGEIVVDKFFRASPLALGGVGLELKTDSAYFACGLTCTFVAILY